MTSNSVCAITINYKNAGDTARCVRSLCSSSVQVDIFVVDNSPRDLHLRRELATLTAVTVVCPDTNLGFGAGNNLGVVRAFETSPYDYILLLNNDATISRNCIEQLLNAASEHSLAGIIAPRIVLDEDPDILWYGGGEVDWFRAAAVTPGFRGSSDSQLAKTSRAVTFASGCAMLFRRSTWIDLNGFDSRFFMYEEDLDICLRTVKAGWTIWYESGALVRHRGQGSFRKIGSDFQTRLDPKNKSLSFFAYYTVRNRILNARLHADGRYRLYAILGLSLFCIKTAIMFAVHRRFSAVQSMIKGIAAAFQMRDRPRPNPPLAIQDKDYGSAD